MEAASASPSKGRAPRPELRLEQLEKLPITRRDTGAFAYMPLEVHHIYDVYRQHELLANVGVAFFIYSEEMQVRTHRCAEALLEIYSLQAWARPTVGRLQPLHQTIVIPNSSQPTGQPS